MCLGEGNVLDNCRNVYCGFTVRFANTISKLTVNFH